MKFIKAFEAFKNKENILNRFNKSEILDLFQELKDDLHIALNEDSISICEMDPTGEEEDIVSIQVNNVDRDDDCAIILQEEDTKNPNCYIIELGEYTWDELDDSSIDKKKLKYISKLLKQKSEAYNFKYMLSDEIIYDMGDYDSDTFRILIW